MSLSLQCPIDLPVSCSPVLALNNSLWCDPLDVVFLNFALCLLSFQLYLQLSSLCSMDMWKVYWMDHCSIAVIIPQKV